MLADTTRNGSWRIFNDVLCNIISFNSIRIASDDRVFGVSIKQYFECTLILFEKNLSLFFAKNNCLKHIIIYILYSVPNSLNDLGAQQKRIP